MERLEAKQVKGHTYYYYSKGEHRWYSLINSMRWSICQVGAKRS